MDSSSDESFAWEKASSGSDDDDIEHSEINGDEDKIKHKHEKNVNEKEKENIVAIEQKVKKSKHRDKENSFDEVESPKKNKKNSFDEVESPKKNKKNSFDEVESSKKNKKISFDEVESPKKNKKISFDEVESPKKNKKISFDEVESPKKNKKNSFDEVESPKKNKIKTEPESDSDARKKKKANMSNINGHLNNSHESDQKDDNEYLNMCVKREQKYLKLPSPVKSKKSKKVQDNDFENMDYNQEKECDDHVPKNLHESDQKDADEYLNMCVKQEQEYLKLPNPVKSKKSKKLQNNDFENMDHNQEKEGDDHVPKKQKKKKKKHSSEDLTNCDNNLQNNDTNDDFRDNSVEEIHEPIKKSPKKKKSKESKLSERLDSPDIEDKFSAEDTKVQNYYDHANKSKTSEYNGNKSTESDHSSNLEDSIHKSDSETNSHNPLKKQLENSKNETASQNDLPKNDTSTNPTLQSTPNNVGSQSKNKTGRLLDQICFEEDPDSDISTTKDNNDTKSFLNKYLKLNRNLQLISKGFQNGSEITNDDEIWILKCPHDIDIQKLNDTDFNLDSKSKIKINGETYCGNLDDTESKITIMTSNENNFIIKNIVANGTIHFRKRLPKAHVQEDNVMVKNNTFIPLPETKCRHPLFGHNYEDAIKVRVRRARADSAATDLEVSATYEKKKKHKKHHSIKPKVEMNNDMSCETSPKIENDSEVPVKKSKKRKQTSNDESFKKKSKRIKLELDSADAWESEKAIEENLFNF